MAACFTAGCNGGPNKVMAELSEANRLSADLRARFSQSANASNRAVMADTDEASVAFAREAEQSFSAVERDVAALKPLLTELGVSEEVELVGQFEERYAAYRKVDNDVLSLAVENTNLKAQSLSFGEEREAADRFKAALSAALPSLKGDEHCRADALVAKAVVAVRELQTLQGPHIASADDAAMSVMEKDIAALQTTAADALRELSGLVDPSGLAAAHTAFDQFVNIGGQIIALSRRNSNVRSLDLALRALPSLSAACDDTLRALEQVLAKVGTKATR